MLSDTFALSVDATTHVAKLVSAPTSHVVAPLVFLHPELAPRTSLRTDLARPLLQHPVFWKLLSVDLVSPGFEGLSSLLFLLNLFARLFHMEDNLALEAVLGLAQWTVMVGLFLALLEE